MKVVRFIGKIAALPLAVIAAVLGFIWVNHFWCGVNT